MDFDVWMRQYRASEIEVAHHLASVASANPALAEDPVAYVRAVYADKIVLLRGPHAYSESGSLHTSVLLHRATVKELFPVATPEAVESLIGVTLDVLKWLVDNKLVLLLIQEPEQYRQLTFLHPILQSSFEPACYEIRDRLIYQHLSQTEYGRLVEAGSRHPVFGLDDEFPMALRETYERHLERPKGRWAQRNAQRYAALASVMGEERLDVALGVPTGDLSPRNIFDVQSRFFYLHRHLLHPLTQGLGGLPYATTQGSEAPFDARRARYGQALETQLVKSLTFDLPTNISVDLIERVQDSSIPDRFEEIEQSLMANTNHHGNDSDIQLALSIGDTVRELDKRSRQLERLVSKRVHGTLRVVGVGATIGLAASHPELSAIIGASTMVPERATEAVSDAFHRVFRKKHLPWQYWHLRRSLRTIDE